MTFLTQVHLNPQRRAAQRILGSPRALHALVEGSLPPRASDPAHRTTWRLDALAHRATLYVVSADRPDLTALVEQAGWPEAEQARTAEYRPFLDRLTRGQEWSFRFCGNPVHSVRTQAGQDDTAVTAHVSVRHQVEWLRSRSQGWGFAIKDDDAVRVVRRSTRRFRHTQGSVTLLQVIYEGSLVVDDASMLRRSLVSGMGRAKAYGCGLMTLARRG